MAAEYLDGAYKILVQYMLVFEDRFDSLYVAEDQGLSCVKDPSHRHLYQFKFGLMA